MLALLSITAFLAFPHDADTVVALPEVVVTATKLPTEREWSPSPVALRGVLQRLPGGAVSAGTAVAGMPGLFVREYGGAGAVQTLSVRGTGAEQSLVLVDGVPVSNRQSGLTDLSTIPAFLLEGAELRRGGGSSLYGSEAVGGVLNLKTRSPRKETYLEAVGSTASFGGSSVGVILDRPISDEAGLSAGFESSSLAGSYPYGPAGGRPTLRLDSDERSIAAYTMIQMTPANSYVNKLLINFTSSDKGAPGPSTIPDVLPQARQAERGFSVSNTYRGELTSRVRLMLGLSGRDSWLRYIDPGAPVQIDNYYSNQSLFAAPAIEFDAGEAEHVVTGAELGIDRAAGNALDGEKERRHAAWFASSALGAYPLSGDGPALSLFPSLRIDLFDGFGSVLSAGLGISLGSTMRSPAVVLHSAVGNNFRAPTFNELYYAGGGGVGNPALGAERSTSFDAGLTFRAEVAGRHELDLTYYRIGTDDRIIWLPLGSPFVWTAENVGTTRSQGIEISYDWKIIPERLTLCANYATTDAERIAPGDPTAGNQLIYVPLDEGAFEASGRIPFGTSMLVLVVADRYTGVRYTVEDGTSSLPGVHLLEIDLGVQVRALGSDLTLAYALRNAADESYELMPRYPMPPRNHELTIRLGRTF